MVVFIERNVSLDVLTDMATPLVHDYKRLRYTMTINTLIIASAKQAMELVKKNATEVAKAVPAEYKIADPKNNLDAAHKFVEDVAKRTTEASREVFALQMKLMGNQKSSLAASYFEQAISLQEQALKDLFEIQKQWVKPV